MEAVMHRSVSHDRRRLFVLAAAFVLLLIHMSGCTTVQAAGYNYRVATSFKKNAVTKGYYISFESARKAASTSSKWYVFDPNGEVVYPRYMRRSDQITRVCNYLRAIAADDRHGFGLDRVFAHNGTYPNRTYPPFTPYRTRASIRSSCAGFGEKGNINCSTGPILAYTLAGYADLIGHGATGAGNIEEVCKKNGFTDVTSKVNLHSGKGLKAGDILIYVPSKMSNPPYSHSHCTIYVGNGQVFWAADNYDGRIGDSSCSEVQIRPYYNRSWQTVLRPTLTKDGNAYPPITVYNGFDFGDVYNYWYYIKKDPKIKELYHGEQMMTFRHFYRFGMYAGKQAKGTFNLSAYKKYNPDLVRKFGNDSSSGPKYYVYYCKHPEERKKRRSV